MVSGLLNRHNEKITRTYPEYVRKEDSYGKSGCRRQQEKDCKGKRKIYNVTCKSDDFG